MGELAKQYQGGNKLSVRSAELIQNPRLFNSEEIIVTKSGIDLKRDNYSEYSDEFGSIKSFKKTSIDKNRETGVVHSNITTLSIIERDNINFLTLRSFDSSRGESARPANQSNSIRIKISKDKEQNLPLLVSTLLERNLLR